MEDWLSGLFASPKKSNTGIKKQSSYKDVPSFEKNQTTNQILCDLRDANLSAELQAEEEIKIMKILTKEHIAESIDVYFAIYNYVVIILYELSHLINFSC